MISLNYNHKAQMQKTMNYIVVKILYIPKKTFSDIKGKSIGWEKVFTSHKFDKVS